MFWTASISKQEATKTIDTEPKTTRQEQAAETRRKLLDSARKLFAKHGYSATPVRAINRSIGMADGLMYHYFPNGKKEILQVLLSESLEKIVADLQQRREGLEDLPVAEVLEQIYLGADAVFTEYLDIFIIFFKESAALELLEREPLEAALHSRRCWFPSYLRKRAETGEIREMDYESAAETLSAILMNDFLIKLTNLGTGQLGDAEHRKRLIEYQVGLWKNPQP
jgi:AcrR family transcriptional regulator